VSQAQTGARCPLIVVRWTRARTVRSRGSHRRLAVFYLSDLSLELGVEVRQTLVLHALEHLLTVAATFGRTVFRLVRLHISTDLQIRRTPT